LRVIKLDVVTEEETSGAYSLLPAIRSLRGAIGHVNRAGRCGELEATVQAEGIIAGGSSAVYIASKSAPRVQPIH
jgi:hypothetical protein